MIRNDYVPFGEEWQSEMMQMRKSDLIEILKTTLQRNEELEKQKINISFSGTGIENKEAFTEAIGSLINKAIEKSK